MINKRLEKVLRKSFAGGNPYPTFAFYGYKNQEDILGAEKRPRLTLYGEVNEDELFASKTKKLEEKLILDEQEREQIKQAETNVIAEKAHIESYNRFKELQKQYGKSFSYSRKRVEVAIKCKASYLPLESRMDRVSFELLLLKT